MKGMFEGFMVFVCIFFWIVIATLTCGPGQSDADEMTMVVRTSQPVEEVEVQAKINGTWYGVWVDSFRAEPTSYVYIVDAFRLTPGANDDNGCGRWEYRARIKTVDGWSLWGLPADFADATIPHFNGRFYAYSARCHDPMRKSQAMRTLPVHEKPFGCEWIGQMMVCWDRPPRFLMDITYPKEFEVCPQGVFNVADINMDGEVDGADYTILMDNWEKKEIQPKGALNNGIEDTND